MGCGCFRTGAAAGSFARLTSMTIGVDGTGDLEGAAIELCRLLNVREVASTRLDFASPSVCGLGGPPIVRLTVTTLLLRTGFELHVAWLELEPSDGSR